jgi:RNA polymerase-interacting CarD/CdnL/TRCF family regulator
MVHLLFNRFVRSSWRRIVVQGMSVIHPKHGAGVVSNIVPNDPRGKMYHVLFDSSEVRKKIQ